MSRYRTLLTESSHGYITSSEITNASIRAEDRTFVSPANPVPKPIPSLLSETSGYGPESIRGVTGREKGYHRATSVYGPASSGYASLRYYGDGVY